MSRLLVVGLLLLSVVGCRAVSDDTVGRNYPCDGGFTDTAQCRDGWVCGREGVCVNPSANEPRACATSAECGGWHCGPPAPGAVFGECYDRATATEVTCRRALGVNGGDCRDGWRCGFDARCYDPATAGAVACSRDAGITGGDCRPDWRCGLDERCYDPSTAGAVACLPDAGATGGDCRADWRCGLDERCYNPADAGSVLCDQDEDCAFPDWRCAVTQPRRCAAVSNEGLLQRGPAVLLTELRTPTVAVNYVDSAVVAQPRMASNSANSAFYAAAEDGGTASLLLTPSGAFSGRADGGSYTALVSVGGSAGIAALQEGDLLVGTTIVRDAGTRLEFSPPDFLAAWTPTRVTVHSLSGGIQTQTITGPPSPIRKVILPPKAGSSLARHDVFALTDDGLYHSMHDGGSLSSIWSPITVPNAPHRLCPGSGWSATNSLKDIAMQGLPGTNTIVVMTLGPEDGGVTARANRYYTFFARGPAAPCDPSWSNQTFPVPTCIAPGQTPVRVFGLEDQWHGFDCRADDPASPVPYTLATHRTNNGAASSTDLFIPARGLPSDYRLIPDRSAPAPSPAIATLVSAEGNLFTLNSGESFSFPGQLIPELYSGSPIAATATEDGGIIVQDNLVSAVGYGPPRVFGEETVLGLAPAHTNFSATTLCGAVEGPGHWVIGQRANGLEVHKASSVRSSPSSFAGSAPWGFFEGGSPAPTLSCSGSPRALHPLIRPANDAQRTPWLLLSAADRIWAGPTALLSTIVPGTFPVISVPAPSTRIDSLTFIEPAPGQTELFVGYALAQERLFQIRAESATRWISTELPVPSGKPLAVFNDGSRARLGFDDGRVLSLPALVPLSSALGERVTQFGVLCGRIYATTLNGFHRLDSVPGQVEGVWAPLTAPNARAKTARARFGKALMVVDRSKMFVIDDVGTIFTLTDATCGQ